jgi:WXG100 family type VII secretion target
MASPTVRANYDELQSIQGTFNAQAESLGAMNDRLRSAMDTLENGDWIGKGATAFYREMGSEIMPALKRLRNAMAEAARLTREISHTMKQAEDEASGCLHI